MFKKMNSRNPCRDFITRIIISSSPNISSNIKRKIEVLRSRCSKITTMNGDDRIQVFFTDGTSISVNGNKTRCDKSTRVKVKGALKPTLECKNYNDLINYFVMCLWYC